MHLKKIFTVLALSGGVCAGYGADHERTIKYPMLRVIYIEWVHNVLTNDMGLDLDPLDDSLALPAIHVVPQSLLQKLFDLQYGPNPRRGRIDGLFRAFENGSSILAANERTSILQEILVHEFTHYVIFFYGNRLKDLRLNHDHIANKVEAIFCCDLHIKGIACGTESECESRNKRPPP